MGPCIGFFESVVPWHGTPLAAWFALSGWTPAEGKIGGGRGGADTGNSGLIARLAAKEAPAERSFRLRCGFRRNVADLVSAPLGRLDQPFNLAPGEVLPVTVIPARISTFAPVHHYYPEMTLSAARAKLLRAQNPRKRIGEQMT